MQERRKAVRRKADQELLQRIQDLERQIMRSAEVQDASKLVERSRRHAIRHTCKVGIELVLRHSSGHSGEWETDTVRVKGKLLDLSIGGASLFTREAIEIGWEVRLAIELRDKSLIHVAGEVRWAKALPEKGGHASGVRFSHIDPKDRRTMAAFFEHLDATAGL